MERPIDSLANKLNKEFGVLVKSYSYSQQGPIVTLLFPEAASDLINAKLKLSGQGISYFATAASLRTKGLGFVAPFVSELKADIINSNPFEIRVQGVYSMIYFFALIMIERS